MKTLVLDTGPIISLSLNNLLWLFKPLKERFGGNFLISPAVKEEVIDKPLYSKRFKFEAFQVLELINSGVIEVYLDKEIEQFGNLLMDIANDIYFAKKSPIKIVHNGEMQSIALAIIKKADAIAIDERTTRLLVENPKKLQYLLSDKLHTSIYIDEEKLKMFSGYAKKIHILRSVELVTVAYELGLMNRFVRGMSEIKLPNAKEELLDSLLWGLKLAGCTIQEKEILCVKKIESKRF